MGYLFNFGKFGQITSIAKLSYCIIFISFILLSSTAKSNTIDIVNLQNTYAEITGIYDSPEHGIVFSNSTGIYKLNKENGEIESILFSEQRYYYSFQYFFEHDNALYFYRSNDKLYKYENSIATPVMDAVVAHYVHNDKLYLIRDAQPRLVMIMNSKVHQHNVQSTGSMHNLANFVEVDGVVYGYLSLIMGGDKFLFDTKDINNIKYIPIPQASIRKLFNVKNELWITTYSGVLRYFDDELVPIDSNFSFSKSNVIDLFNKDDILYLIERNRILKVELSNKSETVLLEMTDDGYWKRYIVPGRNRIYFVVNEEIWEYDFEDDSFSKLNILEDDNLGLVTETNDEEVLLTREDKIEWYNNYPPTIFKDESVYSNSFISLSYDKITSEVVALGKRGDKFYFQKIKDNKFTEFEIPKIKYLSNSQASFEIDKNGNYLVGFEGFLLEWDRNEWKQHSLLKNPDLPEKKQKEYYNILFADSAGGIWLGVYLDEYNEDLDKLVDGNYIWRYHNGKFSKIAHIKENRTVNGLRRGICLKDGTCIVDISESLLYSYYFNSGKNINISDGNDKPKTGTIRTLCFNKESQLIASFIGGNGWMRGYGSYTIPDGLSVLENGVWNHNKYFDIAKLNKMSLNQLRVTYDDYGFNWILSDNKMLRINSDSAYTVYDINSDVSTIGLFGSSIRMLKVDNTIWTTSNDKGLFKFTFPDPASSVKDEVVFSKVLKNEVIDNSFLEFNSEVSEYSIYSILGEKLAHGKNKQIINVSNLITGTYFIYGQLDGKMFIEKFMILNK